MQLDPHRTTPGARRFLKRLVHRAARREARRECADLSFLRRRNFYFGFWS
jgi:hypothetical protein